MADRVTGGITGKGGKNVDPLYNQSFPPKIPSIKAPSLKDIKFGIMEPELRPGGKFNPIKPKNNVDPLFGRGPASIKK